MIRVVLVRIAVALAGSLLAGLVIFGLAGPLPAGADSPLAGFIWLGAALVGEFGQSSSRNAPVGQVLLQSLAVTLPLLLAAALLAAIVGVGFAALLLRLRRSAAGSAAAAATAVVGAVPPLWLGLLLVLVFSSLLHWLPGGGFFAWNENFGGALAALVLPVLALGVPFGATLGLAINRHALALLDSGHVRAGLASGKSLRTVLLPHGMRNGLVGLLDTLRDLLPGLLAATWIVETVFYLPGLGRVIVDAVTSADALLVRAALLTGAALATLLVLMVELGLVWADPRIARRGLA